MSFAQGEARVPVVIESAGRDERHFIVAAVTAAGVSALRELGSMEQSVARGARGVRIESPSCRELPMTCAARHRAMRPAQLEAETGMLLRADRGGTETAQIVTERTRLAGTAAMGVGMAGGALAVRGVELDAGRPRSAFAVARCAGHGEMFSREWVG
jgi:hypothetical protein